MKRATLLTALVGMLVLGCSEVRSPVEFTAGDEMSAPPALAKKGGIPASGSDCTTIQDGILTYSPGHYLYGTPISTGYDPYGYNYQAHLFNGSYANAYLGGVGYPPYEGDDDAYLAANPLAVKHWTWPYRNVKLGMKWNEAWLANTDCDGDGKLDRHAGYPSYIGSGAWLTNHMSGGKGQAHWTYFTKIVAVPADATLTGGVWYAADGTEIGPVIWGQFAVLQKVESGAGATYVSPSGPGLGKW